MDQVQWTIAPYTEADLQSAARQRAARCTAPKATQVVEDVNEFVAGINAYIAEARIDPNKLPAEYAALGKLPEEWKPTDVIAEASLIGGIFGKGGGAEVRSALTLEAFEAQVRQERPDARRGRTSASRTTPRRRRPSRKRFPYETGSPFAKTRARDARPGLGQLRAGRLVERRPRPRRPRSANTDTPDPVAIPTTARSARGCCTTRWPARR